MGPAKITFSQEELELVTDARWILTKNRIIEKIYALFGGLSETYRSVLQQHPGLLPAEVIVPSPKISKGEQYHGLPWVMLDYPRYFTRTDTLAIRSFFWWGNDCTITLHLSGRFLERYAHALQRYFTDEEKRKAWFISTGDDPWRHHFGKEYYQPLQAYHLHDISTRNFIRIGRSFPLRQPETIGQQFGSTFGNLVQIMAMEK